MYSEFTIEKGEYFLDLFQMEVVQKILSITLNGDTFDFSEDFKLEGTFHIKLESLNILHGNMMDEKIFKSLKSQEIQLSLIQMENVMGSVSVDILEN